MLPKFDAFVTSERALVRKWKMYYLKVLCSPLLLSQFMAYMWTSSVGKHDEAMSILKAGMAAAPYLHQAEPEIMSILTEGEEVLKKKLIRQLEFLLSIYSGILLSLVQPCFKLICCLLSVSFAYKYLNNM